MNADLGKLGTVSIIVPVYNGEKYLERCLDSILKQTYKDIEIVCVNDGSTDASAKLLQQYKKQYPTKVFVYEQTNQGIGETRNRGVREATGTYLMFADNDDLLEIDYVEQMVRSIVDSQADMVIAGYRKIREDGTVLEEECLEDDFAWNKFRMMAPWTKIIKRDVVIKHQILFGEIPLGEDSVFSITAINCCEKIAYAKCVGYNWIEHDTSVSNTIQKSDTIDATVVMERIIEENTPLHHLKQYELDYFIYKFLVWHLLYTRKTLQKTAWKNIKEKYFKWLKKNNSMYQKRDIKLGEPKGEKLAIRVLLYLLSTPLRNMMLEIIYRI